jgi:hypothetical protein
MSNKGYLLVMMEAPAALEEEFQAWYDTEHIPERLAVPGFETGLRFVCIEGSPRYLAMYDLADPQVLDSPDYLKVSFESASPWTKRVTSRVKVYRHAGEQIYPGTSLTGRAARLLLLRFRDQPAEAAATITQGMLATYASLPQTNQVRIFKQPSQGGFDYFAMVEARAPIHAPIELDKFGPSAAALDLYNTYVAF